MLAMSTLAEIEAAVDKLPPQQQERLLFFLTARLNDGQAVRLPMQPQAGRNVLDIAPVSVGEVLRPLPPDDDSLDEMLEGRA